MTVTVIVAVSVTVNVKVKQWPSVLSNDGWLHPFPMSN